MITTKKPNPNSRNQGIAVKKFCTEMCKSSDLVNNAVGGTRVIVVDVSNDGDDRGVGSGWMLWGYE